MSDAILLVDDDVNVLHSYQRVLRREFPRLDVATGGGQGLEKLEHQGPFAVVVSDLKMPGMDGLQFLSRVSELSPCSIRIMVTGQGDLSGALRAQQEGRVFRFLTKPCSPNMLGDALRAALEQYRLVMASLQLQEAKEAAEAANRVKSAFLASLTHEICTPMNAILGFSQLLQHDRCLTPEQHDRLAIIAREGENLVALVNNIQDLSRVEAGCVTLTEEKVDLRGLLHDLAARLRLRASSKHLSLDLCISPALPDCVLMDAGKLRRILINLLGNAVRSTLVGGVTLTARVESSPLGRMELLLEVQDTRPGTVEEDGFELSKLFSQAEAGGRGCGGAGLGLAMSREHARLMGGDLTMHSQVGGCTVFTLRLPMQVAAAAEQPQGRLGWVLGLGPGQETRRILSVDDLESNRSLVTQLLRAVGFEVREAADGTEALAVLNDWRPHLVVTGITMPGTDAIELIRRIRESANGERIPVVAVTSNAFEEDEKTVLVSGASDCLRRPFHAEALFESVRRLLEVQYVYEEDPDADATCGTSPSASHARYPSAF